MLSQGVLQGCPLPFLLIVMIDDFVDGAAPGYTGRGLIASQATHGDN